MDVIHARGLSLTGIAVVLTGLALVSCSVPNASGRSAPGPACVHPGFRSAVAYPGPITENEFGIVGRVVSAQSLEPIAGVTVKLEPGDYQTVSDTLGRFSFNRHLRSNIYTLSASGIGFTAVAERVPFNGVSESVLVIMTRREWGLLECVVFPNR
jgi:hypothetical protein